MFRMKASPSERKLRTGLRCTPAAALDDVNAGVLREQQLVNPDDDLRVHPTGALRENRQRSGSENLETEVVSRNQSSSTRYQSSPSDQGPKPWKLIRLCEVVCHRRSIEFAHPCPHPRTMPWTPKWSSFNRQPMPIRRTSQCP
uniref:(northern house mosquito) hypothetical protein n=1 Tax=Culex pipiens TaxID=7175 RepID=A0A8D8FDG1_CULPI